LRAVVVVVGAEGASIRMIAATVANPTTIATTPHNTISRSGRPRLGAGRG